ncbi:MAG: TolC family protein [Archangiaceae bacterium]|nr:TolC family protein [Archangiaceae bacterium]
MISLLVSLALAAEPHLLTLDEALQTSRTHQPALRQATANTRAADARVTQARAPLLPQLNASARYNLTTANIVPQVGTNVGAGSGTGGGSNALVNSTSASLTLSQLVWDFGQTLNRYQSVRASAEATAEDERATRVSVAYQVRAAFFAARAQKELLLVARETRANQDRHFEQVQGFVEVGTRPPIDLAQAKTDRANARVQLISSQNGYASARAALNQAMGVEGPSDFDVSNDRLPPVEEEALPLEDLFAAALQGRPELRALDDRVRAAQQLVSAARGAFGPSISAVSGITGGGRDTDLSGNVTVIGVSVSWNLFGGFADWGRVQEADANVTALLAQVDALRQQVRLQIEQAWLQVHSASESLTATEEAEGAARERLRLAEGRYETGVGNILELADAQLSLTNAAAQRVQADYNLSTARAQLLQTLGRP